MKWGKKRERDRLRVGVFRDFATGMDKIFLESGREIFVNDDS